MVVRDDVAIGAEDDAGADALGLDRVVEPVTRDAGPMAFAARTAGVLRASEIPSVSAVPCETAMMPDVGAPEEAEPEDALLSPMSAEQPENVSAAKEKAMAAERAR